MDLLALKRSLMPLSGPQDSGGGGGGSAPANTTSTSTNTAELPEWARGYAKDTLAKGAALTDLNQNPYQAYGGNRIAGFSNLQNQSFQGAQDMTVAPQIGQGTAAATGAGLGGLNVAGQANVGGFQNQVGGYMNPYMNQILAPQLAEANRNYDIGAVRQQQGASQAGAFGGSREAIMAAENERNRNTGLNQIYGQGLNTAYSNAQNQYNQNLQNQLAGYGLMGQSANTLGQLGQNQYQQQMGINALQNQYGGQQQAQQQRGLDTAYQDFQNQKNYPYKQLGFMSDMIRGLPLGQQSTAQMYQPPGSAIGQIAGLGVGALGLAGLGKTAGVFAEGGEVQSYDDGGITGAMNDPYQMADSVDKLSDEQLQAILQRPSSPAEFRAAQDEMAMRASEDHGVASMVPPYMSDDIVSAAGGGILAFDEGGTTSRFREMLPENLKSGNEYQKQYAERNQAYKDLLEANRRGPGLFGQATKEAIAASDAEVKAAGDRLKGIKPKMEMGENLGATDASLGAAGVAAMMGKEKAKPSQTAGGTGGPRIGNTGDAGGAGGAGGKDDFETEMARVKEFFKDPENEAANKRMEEMLGKREGKVDEAKQRAFYGFLANAGANIAQSASKSGKSKGIRGLLESTAEAAPASAQFANEAQKGIDTLEDTNFKLNLEYQKLKIAERKNDKTAMLSAYQNIRALKQHEATLAEAVRHNRATEGLTGQHYAALKGQYANKSMAPYINAYGKAEDRAIQATNGYMKTNAGLMDKRPYPEIVEEFAKKYRKSAGASMGFGPTGNIYNTDEDS
jgi:hypothetical protein